MTRMRILPLLFIFLGLPFAMAQSSRPFTMSSTGVQAQPGQSPLYQNFSPSFTPSVLSPEVDVVTLFPEYLGVPFDSFANTNVLPANDPWAIKATALADAPKAAGKPHMVQIVLTRDIVVAKAVNQNGASVVQPGWVTGCIDMTNPAYVGLGQAYVNYATWIARTFSPKYMVVAIEANLYYVNCGGDTASWRALVNIERRAYDAVKAVKSSILAFPSYKLEELYGQTLTGFDQTQWRALANFKKDRLGLATYPSSNRVGGVFINPYQLPSDYLARIKNRNWFEPRIVITETGWNSASLSLRYQGSCVYNYIYSSPEFQAAYLERLLYSASVSNFEHVSWWSYRDLIPSSVMSGCYPDSTPPYTECNGDLWCATVNNWRATSNGWTSGFAELAFKSFGTMGLRQYDGTPNAASIALWQRFFALRIVGN